MRISREWLSDFVDFDELSTEEFSELITTKVAEVDEVETAAAPLQHAVVGQVRGVSKHPTKDKLQLATVQTGKEEVQVVCGAANCREGLLVAYVPPGGSVVAVGDDSVDAKLLEVGKREFGGVESVGVLVSEAELGLSGEHSGIAELEASLKPGTALTQVFGAPDTVLVIDNKSLTHRPDLWGHYGFARELAAILSRPLKIRADDWADDDTAGAELLSKLGTGKSPNFSVEIDPATKCRRFIALEIDGVRAMPSPLWMRRRLYAVGAGIRNFLVDLSNYVMHDVGQPNHAYDADKLSGNIVRVRNAAAGEKFLGLDDLERELAAEDVVIADEKTAVALGGVMGGKDCSIFDSTKRLLLESANFDPVQIRLTTKRHQLRTDASNRFEKDRSVFATPLAIHRFCQLLKAECSEAEVVGSVSDCFVERPAAVSVALKLDYVRERLSEEISDEKILSIIESLGFHCGEPGSSGERAVAVPHFRATRDVRIADDLVEEVGRIYGYENIPEEAPAILATTTLRSARRDLEGKVRGTLSGLGFSEHYDYSFMDAAIAEKLGYATDQLVELANPVDTDSRFLRTTLVPAMIQTIEQNTKFQSSIALYELGRTYHPERCTAHLEVPSEDDVKNSAGFERRLLSLGYLSGLSDKAASQTLSTPLMQGGDFYALAGVLKRIGGLLCSKELSFQLLDASKNTEADNFQARKNWMHPHRSAAVVLNETAIGVIAEVRPELLRGVRSRAVVAEIDLALLLHVGSEVPKFKDISRFPDSLFEMSVVMPDRTSFSELRNLISSSVDSDVLRDMEVVAVYQGKPLEAGQKSVSVKLSLGTDDRTLSGEELQGIQDSLIAAVGQSTFELRS